jgi:hypothetical protein
MYKYSPLLLCVALHLPRPLSKECIWQAKQLEKATEGSDEQADLLAQLEQHAAWNEWVQVAQIYFLLQGKTNTPRKFFMYWRYKLFERLQNNAYRNQYNAIASTIQRKGASQEVTNIDIHALFDSLGNNPHQHPHDPQVGNGGGIADAAAIVAVIHNEVVLEEGDDDDDDNDNNTINNNNNDDDERISELKGQVQELQTTIQEQEATIQKLRETVASLQQQLAESRGGRAYQCDAGGSTSVGWWGWFIVDCKHGNLGFGPAVGTLLPDANVNSKDNNVSILYYHFEV